MKKILYLLIILLPGVCYPQANDFPPTDSLIQSIKNHHHEIEKAINLKYVESKKGEWIKWLPAIGIGYTPNGSPRPTASYSLATVLNIKKAKHQQEQRRLSEIELNNIELRKRLIGLSKLLRQRELSITDLGLAERLFQIDEELFNLQKKKFDHNEIKASDFLKMKQAFLKKQYDLSKKKEALAFAELEILAFTFYNSQ